MLRFTETALVKAIKEYEGGCDSKDVCRELQITTEGFY